MGEGRTLAWTMRMNDVERWIARSLASVTPVSEGIAIPGSGRRMDRTVSRPLNWSPRLTCMVARAKTFGPLRVLEPCRFFTAVVRPSLAARPLGPAPRPSTTVLASIRGGGQRANLGDSFCGRKDLSQRHAVVPAPYCALHKIGVHHEETHSPRGKFERGDGSPLSVGSAGRAPCLPRPEPVEGCKRGSLPRERSVAGARSTLLPQR